MAEREQGVWRRYRLLPSPTLWLVFSAMLARVLIVASSVLVQVALARAIFGTPFPSRPAATVPSFLVVTAAFLGIGLLIAALAENVPAVQALGQCIFLPMILIGGVGVPLAVLPLWAQRVAGFMPGRYAVEVSHPCFSAPAGLHASVFPSGSLAAIGAVAGVAGTKLFRWEPGPRTTRARWWVAAALASWAAVGALAWASWRLKPVLPEGALLTDTTEAEIAEIWFDGLPADNDIVAPLAPPDLDIAQEKGLAGSLRPGGPRISTTRARASATWSP